LVLSRTREFWGSVEVQQLLTRWRAAQKDP
jgi:hypothetical protein